MKTTVNERIKLLRTQLNVTQQEFAEAVGITSQQLSRIENGNTEPQQNTLKKISNELSVPVEWILYGKGEPSPKLKSKAPSIDSVWKDEAFNALKDEVKFYRQLLTQMTGGKAVNFLQALNLTGLNKKRSLGAAA